MKKMFSMKASLFAVICSVLIVGIITYFDMLDHPSDYCEFDMNVKGIIWTFENNYSCVLKSKYLLLNFTWVLLPMSLIFIVLLNLMFLIAKIIKK